MRESKIESALRKGVEDLGGTCEKFTAPGRRFVPDRLVCWPSGHKLWESDLCTAYLLGGPLTEFIETKAPDGQLHPGQARDHDRRRTMGFEVHVIWNMEQAEAYLRSRGKR